MKKSYFGLLLAALVTLGSCTKENTVNPDPVVDPATQGDLFMTMNIAMASQVGTRTETPNQGYEVGKDRENKISKALIILAQAEGEGDTEHFTIKFAAQTGLNLQNTVTDSGHGDVAPTNPPATNKPADGNYLQPDPNHLNQYKAAFTFDRAALKAALTTDVTAGSDGEHTGTKGDFVIFMVANPTPAIIAAAVPNADIQSVITAASNPARTESGSAPTTEVFWQDNYFVMSSAFAVKKTIYSDEIKEGTCTTKDKAYKLGTVTVQRVMSRFDLATSGNNLSFAGAGDNSTTGPGLSGIKVDFDAFAMVNMAKSAYLYKVMAPNASALTNNQTYPTHFGDERDADYLSWWTVTPDQVDAQRKGDYFNPLFADFEFNSTTPKESQGTYEGLSKFFAPGADFQTVADLTEEDNEYEAPNHVTGTGAYRIWRYAMENTNPYSADNQVNGNSTGIVFRAKLSEVIPEGQAETYERKIPVSYLDTDPTKVGRKIYAYNNVILGTAEQLFKYVTTPKADTNDPVYDDVQTIYWPLIRAKYDANWNEDGNDYTNKGESDWWIEEKTTTDPIEPGQIAPGGITHTIYHHGDLEASGDTEIMAQLVKAGFSIYTPTKVGPEGSETPVYYCYYIYWNRHNDNGQNTIMGDMEFATVRNNVYKLSVTKVLNLGHPGEPGNDPFPPKPGTPDEEDIFWLEVNCQILPWEVRINDIEF